MSNILKDLIRKALEEEQLKSTNEAKKVCCKCEDGVKTYNNRCPKSCPKTTCKDLPAPTADPVGEGITGKCKYKCPNGAVITANCCKNGKPCEGNRKKVCAGKGHAKKDDIKEIETVSQSKNKGCPKSHQCKKDGECAKFHNDDCGH